MTRRLASICVLVVLGGTGCLGSSLTQGPKLAKDQTLLVQLQDQPASLDPGQTQYPFETAVLRAIAEPLLKPSADMQGVLPAAAESYETKNNGTVYVFHLRKNAQYNDGQPVRAQDFVFAWQRLIDPNLAAPNGVFFADAILNGDAVATMDPQQDKARIGPALATLGLKAVDDFTFQVTLARPDPAFVWLAAMPAGAPIRKDVVDKAGTDKWAAKPETLVTNGPFHVTQMVANTSIRVVPNKHYWGTHPILTAIDFEVIADGAAALARYKGSDLDVMTVDTAQATGVAADAQLKRELVKTPALTVYWLAFHVSTAPFNNAKVRLAVSQALDRDAFVRSVFGGEGLPAGTLIPKGMRGYLPGVAGAQKFDVSQARSTLASSGVPPAQLTGIKFAYDSSSDFGKATASFVRDQLKANLGIDVTPDPQDRNTFNTHLGNGSFAMAGALGWSADYPDPSDWYDIFRTTDSNNFDLYQSKQFDQFVKAADSDLNETRRDGEYQQALQVLVGDSPVAFLAQSMTWNLVRPYVHGITTTAIEDWPGELTPQTIYLTEH